MNFFERDRYFAPAARLTVCRPATAPNSHTFGVRVTCLGGTTKGRTNGMPWAGNSPCTEGTQIDGRKPLPVSPERSNTPVKFWDLENLWKMPDNPWFPVTWISLSTDLEEMAQIVCDAEFAEELQFLADIAYTIWLQDH